MVQENIAGIPDVDLSSIVKDLEDQDKDQIEKPVKDQVMDDLAQFKTPQDLLKAYKELQGAYTTTSQNNKTLEKRMTELQEQVELSKSSVNFIHQDPQFDDSYVENPQATIHQTVLTQRIAEILEDEQDAHPDEFNDRYVFAQRVIQQYPQLANSPGGVKKAFKYGDKLRQEALKESTSKALESVFGEPLNDEELNRLRTLVKGDKSLKTDNKQNLNAYMPDTDTSTNRTQTQNQNQGSAEKIKRSVEAGDVDGVLDEMFSTIMADEEK